MQAAMQAQAARAADEAAARRAVFELPGPVRVAARREFDAKMAQYADSEDWTAQFAGIPVSASAAAAAAAAPYRLDEDAEDAEEEDDGFSRREPSTWDGLSWTQRLHVATQHRSAAPP